MDKAILAYDNVKTLMDTAEQVQSQLREALRIINFRDRQIFAAMDALEAIGGKECQCYGESCPCFDEFQTGAQEAINKMREIHKESLG